VRLAWKACGELHAESVAGRCEAVHMRETALPMRHGFAAGVPESETKTLIRKIGMYISSSVKVNEYWSCSNQLLQYFMPDRECVKSLSEKQTAISSLWWNCQECDTRRGSNGIKAAAQVH